MQCPRDFVSVNSKSCVSILRSIFYEVNSSKKKKKSDGPAPKIVKGPLVCLVLVNHRKNIYRVETKLTVFPNK